MRRRITFGARPLRDAIAGGVALILIGFLAYSYYEAGFYQPLVIEQGSVVAYRGINRGQKVTAQTRFVRIGRGTFWQVEASPGDWRDCGSDCAAVLRRLAFPE